MHRRTALLCLLCLALCACGLATAAEWWEKAAEQTRDEFNTVKDSVEQTVKTLDEVHDKLWEFEQWARQHLTGDELKQALDKVREARETLDKYTSPLRKFSDRVGNVSSAIDALAEMKDLAEAARKRQGGRLASALHVAAHIMEKYGQKVPIIGKAIEVYGKVTMGILDATDKIAKTIKENRNQGMLGAGIYQLGDDPKWQALVKQFPDLANSGATFAPGEVPYVYEEAGASPGWSLIWDPKRKQWYKVNISGHDVAEIYRQRVIAKGHPDPWELAVLARNIDKLNARRTAAREAMDIWRRARDMILGPVGEAFEAVNARNDFDLSLLIRDGRAFVARYSQDYAFRNRINRLMAELYAEIIKRGGKAPSIEKWAKKHGVNLAALAAANQQSQQQAQGTQQPSAQTTTTTQPQDIKLSIVFLVDCSGSMSGTKLDAAKRAVVASVNKTNDGHTEWALLAFGSCTVREIVGFTSDPAAITSAVGGLSARGDTPLTYATYKAIAYLVRNAHGQQGRLVVLCDGQDNCPERGSTSREEAMAGLRTIVRVVTPAAASTPSTGGGTR